MAFPKLPWHPCGLFVAHQNPMAQWLKIAALKDMQVLCNTGLLLRLRRRKNNWQGKVEEKEAPGYHLKLDDVAALKCIKPETNSFSEF